VIGAMTVQTVEPADSELIDDEIGGTVRGALEARAMADGSTIVAVDVDLPHGWNRTWTRVWFVLPIAFPSGQPDCFFADLDLRLGDGNMPMNSGIQPLDDEDRLWFSWHLSTWSPSTDGTATYLRFIERRLHDVR